MAAKGDPVSNKAKGPTRQYLIFCVLWGLTYGGTREQYLHRLVSNLLKGRRGDIYSSLVDLEGTLLGFALAALTIVLGYSQADRLSVLRASRHWGPLFSIYISAVRWSAIAVFSSLASLLFDDDSSPKLFLTCFCFSATTLTAYYVVRMLWVTERIVQVVISTGARNPGE